MISSSSPRGSCEDLLGICFVWHLGNVTKQAETPCSDMDMDNVQMQLIMTADQYIVMMSHNKRLDEIKHFSITSS